jgi:uncharacterized protein (TIGR02147 family)
MAVYSFKDYKLLMKHLIQVNKEGRGYQRRMAEAASCQSSLLSQVLGGPLHLTPDQASGLCEFWHFNDDESDYFMNLVYQARAATPRYRKILESKLEEIRRRHREPGNIRKTKEISAEYQAQYFSTWHFQALHMAAAIPGLDTVDKIASKTGLPIRLVRDVVNKLVDMNLLQETAGKLKVLQNNLHLPRTSPLLSQSHLIWRQVGAMKIQQPGHEDFHYTAVYAISRADFKKIQDLLAEFLHKMEKVVGPSKEEDLYLLAIDSFGLFSGVD